MSIIITGLIFFVFLIPAVRRIFFLYLPLLPKFGYWKAIDIYRYYKNKEWTIFEGFGLHIFIGLFGKGKTISMVETAYNIAKRYPQVKIYSNIKLMGFPEHTEIIRLINYHQIIESPGDSLFLIDEISTLFQSRNWSNFPMPLLSQLLQVRKNKKMILATAQRFAHVDKLIRDVTYSVIDCDCRSKRWNFCSWYIAEDWEAKNPMVIPQPYDVTSFVQSDKLRSMYDTYELIDNLKKDEFLTSEEILTRQAGTSQTIAVLNEKKKKTIGK